MAHRRRIDARALQIATAGVALLKLHARRDPSGAAELVSEIKRTIESLDDDELEERATPLVDVLSGYRRWAEVYDEPGNQMIDCEEPAVRPLLDAFPAGVALDAACGTGRHLAYLASRGRSVVGVDVSAEMLAKARAKVPSADLRVGDVTALPLGDAEVCGVVCSLALEHIEDLDRAYAELGRVTSPGGPVVVSTIHPVLRTIFGWGAWFIDGEGKTDIPTFEHTVSDHINAGVRAGLTPTSCSEPAPPDGLLPPDAPMSTRIAYEETPMVLVLAFERRA